VRIERVIVEHFQAIERAQLDLAGGLNVLYGPNDLGKSTLARAIRAAFLLPCGSSKGNEYVSWSGAGDPHVTVVFTDSTGRYWRIRKTFGDRNTAILESSKDGKSYGDAVRLRQADEKLRELLAWGAGPTGKGGVHGLPNTFLSQVLLAEQTDVDAILEASLESDPDDSGRLQLTKALGALAQDPLFKKILEETQSEVDQLFTPKGQRKRGAASKFTKVTEAVSKLQMELTEAERKLAEAEVAERNTSILRVRRTELEDLHNEAIRMLERVEALRVATTKHEEARGLVAEEQQKLEAIEERFRALVGAKEALRKLDVQLAAKVEAKAELEPTIAALAKNLEEARAALSRVTGPEARAEAMLKRGAIEKRRALLEEEERGHKERRRIIDEVRAKAAIVTAIVDRSRSLEVERHSIAEAAAKSSRDTSELEVKISGLRDLLAFGRWRELDSRLTKAREELSRAEELEAEVARKSSEARDLRASIDARALPSEELLRKLTELETELKVAEGALAVGLSVRLCPDRSLSVEVRADDRPALAMSDQKEELTVEATRAIHLNLGGVAKLHIEGGAAEARFKAEKLAMQWREQAEPILAAASVSSLMELRSACEQRRAVVRLLSEIESEIKRATTAASERRSSAGDVAILVSQAEELQKPLAGHDQKALSAALTRAGARWQSESEAHILALQKALQTASSAGASAETKALSLAEEVSRIGRDLAEARRELESLASSLGEPVDAALKAIELRGSAISAAKLEIAAELKALDDASAQGTKDVEARIIKANAELSKAEAARSAIEAELVALRSSRDQKRGELALLESQVVQLPRKEVGAALDRARQKLEETPLPEGGEVTEAEVREAEEVVRMAAGKLEHVRTELLVAEAQLKGASGPIARERRDALRAAHERALQDERQLDRDAKAWKLLLETLQESENASSAHLGRALADKVGANFQSLTNGRYGSVEVSPDLGTEGIEASGDVRAVDVLSVGTREQLATLLRLAIAESLGTMLVLDDHLVQSDRDRLAWFWRALNRASEKIQVIVLTCRREDYELGAAVAWCDLGSAIVRHQPSPPTLDRPRAPREVDRSKDRPPATVATLPLPPKSPRARPAKPEAPNDALELALRSSVNRAIPERPSAAPEKVPLGVLLKQALDELKMSPGQFANEIQVGPRVVELWLGGKSEPTPKLKAEIARYLRRNGRGAVGGRVADLLDPR
jgi:hypothetical protein